METKDNKIWLLLGIFALAIYSYFRLKKVPLKRIPEEKIVFIGNQFFCQYQKSDNPTSVIFLDWQNDNFQYWSLPFFPMKDHLNVLKPSMEGKILSEGAEIEIQSKEKKIFLNLKNNIKTGQNLIPDSFLIENILYEQKSCPWDPRSYTAKVLEREKKGEISLYCLQSPINGAFQSILLDQINLKFSSWSSKFPLGKYDLEKSPNMEGNYKVQGNKVILSHNEKEITLQVIMDPNDKIISFILGHKRPPMTQNDCNLFYPQKNENYFCSNAIEGKGSTILKLNLEENKFDLWAQSFEWTGIPKGPPMESGIISKTPKGIKISLNHKKIPITILKEDPQTQVPLEIEIEGNKLAPSLCRF